MLLMFYHNGQFFLQIDTFSLLHRCETTNIPLLQTTKQNMPRHFHVARLSSVWTSKKKQSIGEKVIELE